VFAVSFLGAFEITLPSSWGTKVDSQADKGGLIGIFFMALALAIVSFSCTGPIVGTALVAAAAQGGIAPVISMFGFSLAIALPFALFAAFPGWMNSLPKSGGWLNTVKVVLGFLELALAFKFLSNADLVNQWNFLQREVFIAIWIAITIAMAMYLFGKIQLPHDAPVQNIGVFRFLFGLFTLSFAIYLLPGMWGAPLNIISGFPPPIKYAESKFGVGFTKNGSGNCDKNELPEHAEYGPNNIVTFEDYEYALAYAKKVNKPVLIDFTGRACQNCRLMEENVWSKDKILSILNNEVVLVSLYVDDRTKLPEDKQYISKYTGEKVTTVGQKWSEMETFIYKNNSQPLYVIIDHNENRMNDPVGYTPDVDEYYKWLRHGIDNFKKQK
jgi:thiol:disulfide interchange protein DsbD